MAHLSKRRKAIGGKVEHGRAYLEYALERTVLLRAQPEERTAILRIAKDVFGELCQAKADKGKDTPSPPDAASAAV